MNPYTRWIAYWNRQVAKFSIYDVKLAQGAAMAFALIAVKIWPSVLDLHIGWFIAACVLCSLHPWYVVLKKDDPGGAA